MIPVSYTKENFYSLCDQVTSRDRHLQSVLQQYGYPPLWERSPGFETLIHIILEQQVSLASAKAALVKLRQRIGAITPKKLLALSDAELKACYFSRQKASYAKGLATGIVSGEIKLKSLSTLAEPDIRQQLKAIKGIGDWTVDVYLIFALKRTDVFPIGDLAMVNALKELKQLPNETPREKLLIVAERWRPYRSIATVLLWHYYIQKRGIKI